MTDTPTVGRLRVRWPVAAAAVVCAVALGVVLYGRTPLAPKTAASGCARSAELARAVAPLARGEVAAMNAPAAIEPMPALAFQGPDGKPRSLAEFRGKTLLVNLWATWCVPCRQEMPALDRLQAQAGSDKFEIVAVNIDTTRLERARAFLDEVGVKSLAFYADPKAEVFYRLKQAGKVVGLPTTFLVGPDGCEIGALAGAANWASEDALALVKGVAGS